MDSVARKYVRHVLAVGQHDPSYVDAYYGPHEWKVEVEAQKASLQQIREEAMATATELEFCQPLESDPVTKLRKQYLAKQLEALIARVDMLSGKEMSFDEESKVLYDVVAPSYPDSHYASILARLEPLLPGEGPLNERYDRFREGFYIPKDKLDQVFRASIDAARDRTKQYIQLPDDESFHLEYVTGEVWGGYNWYKGNAHSLIQINVDFPVSIDRALSLACHEGYPGHHVYNTLMERDLVQKRGWPEFSVYALFGPQSLIAEGTAEYGVELSFPPEERLAFERDVLFPLAGLDASLAEQHAAVLALMDGLGWAANDAARNLLDGKASHEETVDWLVTYTLSTPERAQQRIRFFEQNRSYIVTYDVGQDLVKRYVEAQASTTAEKWEVFAMLLCTPQAPSGLQ